MNIYVFILVKEGGLHLCMYMIVWGYNSAFTTELNLVGMKYSWPHTYV